jgi:hypothetical protein
MSLIQRCHPPHSHFFDSFPSQLAAKGQIRRAGKSSLASKNFRRPRGRTGETGSRGANYLILLNYIAITARA